MTTPADALPCPSCGFLLIGEPSYGTFEICPLCDWEDDPVQLANPLTGGGANRESLLAYQVRSVERWPVGVDVVEHKGRKVRRDRAWRPLSADEVGYYTAHTSAGREWVFKGISTLDACYWVKSPVNRRSAEA